MVFFYVLLTVHLDMFVKINQYDAQLILSIFLQQSNQDNTVI